MSNSKRPFRFPAVLFAACCALLFAGAAIAQDNPAAPGAEIDWSGLYAEAGQYFRGYLRYDTSNPPGNVESAIGFIKKILDMEEIKYETFVAAPGKVNLVALGVVYVLGFTVYSSTMAGFESWMTGTPSATALFFAAAASVSLLLNRWQAREPDGAATLDYEDRGDPVVRTLDLTPQ